MLLEVEIPAETFVTNATSERFLFVVGVHVKGQVVDLQKKLELSQDHLVFSDSLAPHHTIIQWIFCPSAKGSSINNVDPFFLIL